MKHAMAGLVLAASVNAFAFVASAQECACIREGRKLLKGCVKDYDNTYICCDTSTRPYRPSPPVEAPSGSAVLLPSSHADCQNCRVTCAIPIDSPGGGPGGGGTWLHVPDLDRHDRVMTRR